MSRDPLKLESGDAVERLLSLHDSENIAEHLSDAKLREIGSLVVREYKIDKDSRADWEQTIDKSMEIAKQTFAQKDTPWQNAANVKFPLMSFAAIQFAARTYPELVRNDKVVQGYVTGTNPDDDQLARAQHISTFSSWQLLFDDEDWESETDKLLHMLPIVGTVFRKTYYNQLEQKPCFNLCDPKSIVVNNSTKSIETARRITHMVNLCKNDVVERIRSGVFCEDFDIGVLSQDSYMLNGGQSPLDEDIDHPFLEQHRWLDLDEDGYQEPYIVMVHKQSERVAKIVARWDLNGGMKFSADGKMVVCIKPVCMFTDYHLIPNPDGSFYSLGFGTLLYPINETINSSTNQLLDSATLQNMQSGFIGSALRIGSGRMTLEPGEWKKVETVGSTIAENIYPLPTKEPSQTLFNLLQFFVQTGKDLSGVIDILPEDQQTQNVPATTILSLLDQRMKPLKAIYKRLYRSFTKEFRKQYRLNNLYPPNPQIYAKVLGFPNANPKEDFADPDYDVRPVADPGMSSESQRLLKVQALKAALGEPGGNELNAREILARWLAEFNLQSPDKLIAPEQPPSPPPELVKAQMEQQTQMADIQRQAQKDQGDFTVAIENLRLKSKEHDSRVHVEGAKIEKMKADAVLAIENAHKEHTNKTVEHIMGVIDAHYKKRELDLKEQEIKNDQLQPSA